MMVLLFDGVCNLCSWAVRFVIARDPEGRIQFASLQSQTAEQLLTAHGLQAWQSLTQSGFSHHSDGAMTGPLMSVILLEAGQVSTKSTAVLRVCKHLRGLWPLLYLLTAVPKRWRDGVYDYIAKHRYGWFGKREVCLVPTPEVQGRFLDAWEDR